jgi:hypothetical protein
MGKFAFNTRKLLSNQVLPAFSGAKFSETKCLSTRKEYRITDYVLPVLAGSYS